MKRIDLAIGIGGAAGQGIATPGDITRLRFGGHFRARDKVDRWEVQVSFDEGKSFRSVDAYIGPTQGKCQYTTVAEIPPGTRKALVRWRGEQRNTTCLFSLRIDADFREPHGGFCPVKITYLWTENGVEKRDVHVATKPRDAYTIRCRVKPVPGAVDWGPDLGAPGQEPPAPAYAGVATPFEATPLKATVAGCPSTWSSEPGK